MERTAEHNRLAELLDLQEGRLGVPLLDDDAIRELLGSGPRIAVIGASNNPSRPSHGVFMALRKSGYDVVPVNPREQVVDGLPCFRSLQDAVTATGAVDIVDVFRRHEACPAHAREAVEVGARCLWLQLGIVSQEAGRIAAAGGLSVVMDRCTIVEHDRLIRT
ncbi:MAG: CoA-binding protein [Chloroflexota bacterium]